MATYWQFSSYALPLLAAAAMTTIMSLYAWRHRAVTGAAVFALLMLASAIWSLSSMMELLNTTLPGKTFWLEFKYLGAASVPSLWLVFALEYTGHTRWLTRRNLAVLAAVPVVMLVIVFTNDWHHLQWGIIELQDSQLKVTHGILFWIYTVVCYLLLLPNIVLFWLMFSRSSHLYRRQAGMMLLGGLIPAIVNVLYNVFGLKPLPGLDPTPFAFTLAGVFFGLGLFRFRLFDVVPVARDTVIENMADGVFVVDMQGRIVDANPAMLHLLGRSAEQVVGQPAAQSLAGLPELIERYRAVPQAHDQITLGQGEAQRHLDLRISPLYGRHKQLAGRVVVLRDITERKQAEEALRESESRYRELYAATRRQAQEAALLDQVRTAVARELDVPGVIRTVVEGIAQTFGYPLVSLYMRRGNVMILQHQVGYDQVIQEIPITEGVLGKVVRTGQPILVQDIRADPDFLAAVPGISSEVCVPLFDRENVVGALNIEGRQGVELVEADLRLLTALSEYISVALGRARLYTQIQENEERYRLLFYQSPVGIIHFDPQLRITDCNYQIASFFRSKRELMLGFDLSLIEDQSALPALRQALAGMAGQYEGPYHATPGSAVTWVLMRTTPLFDEHGQVRGGIAIVEDITGRVRAEQELRASERQLRMVADNIPGFIAYVDAGLRYRFVNKRYIEAFGLEDRDIIGQHVRHVLGEAYYQHTVSRMEAALSGQPVYFETTMDLPRQGTRWLSINYVPEGVEPGRTGGVYIMALDITERQRMENALRESEALYRSLVSAMPQSLCRKDLEGRFTFANQRFCAEFHKSLDEIVGKTDFDIHPAEQADKYHRDDRWVIETGNTLEMVEEHQPLGGPKTFVQVVKSPIQSADGKIIGVQTMFWDVTARRLAEQAEREQRNLAEALRDTAAALNSTLELDEVLDRILANVGRVVLHDAANIALVDDQGVARVVRARGYAERGLATAVLSVRLQVFDTATLRRMAETGQPIILPDTHAGTEWIRLPDTEWVRSYAGVPIRVRGRTAGFLNLDSAIPGFFTLEHADRLQAFADQAALAIQNANLYIETRQRAEHTSILYRIGLAITSSLDLEQLSRTLLEQCRSVLPVDSFYVALYDEATFQITHPFFYDLDELRVVAPRDIRQQPGLSGAVIQRRQVLYLPDTLEPDTAARFQIVRTGGPKTRSFVGVPLISRDHVIGVISMQSYEPNAYTAEQIHLLETIATQAAIAIENARLYTQARHHAQELEQANRKAEEARRAAEAANRAKSVFLANMSHELRTPLNAILGFSDLMSRDANAQLTAEQKENLAIINRSGEHLLSLINDVLDMAKIESGRTILQEHTFDLHRLLDELIDLFHARAADKGLTLLFERAPAVPRHVAADESKLRQIVINLLGNAVKFTQEGGIGLRVKTDRDRDRDREKGSNELADSLSLVSICFEVQDTGPGIAPEDLENIFDPFVQSGREQKLIEGTGLGLSISRQFARLMGGDLTAASEGIAGLGALFTLDIPVHLADPADLSGLAKSEPARSEVIGLAADQHAAGSGGPYRLLVAEDREENRQLLVKLLTHWGFAVRAAVNGLEAVNIWKEWQPHLIWMDMRMPIMDGHEATRRIKATPSGRATIIIALTATAFEEDREQVLAEGCDDFVRKPFKQDELADKLVQHLGVRFVYAEAAGSQAGPPQPATLDLTGLPAGWVADLRQAAIEADADRIVTLAEQVREQNPTLACAIVEWASNFQYKEILDALHPTNMGDEKYLQK